MAELTKLINIRGGHKSAITRLSSQIEQLISEEDYDRLSALSSTIKTQLAKTTQLSDQIYNLLEDKELEKDIVKQMEDEVDINNSLARIDSVLKSKTVVKGSKTSTQTLYKLPKLTLPTFNGDHTLWTGFWDVFEHIIDSHKELSDVQKFTYLKGQMEGEAAELIKGFKVEGISYAVAVDLLKTTYGQPDKIKAALVQQLVDLTVPIYEVSSLKNFYASFESTVRAMHNMKITADEMMTVILTTKVPSPLREVIRRELGKDTLNLNDFMERFQLEVYNMDQTKSVPEYTGATAAFATPVSRKTTTKLECRLCQANHPWYKCTRYVQSSQKIKRAKNLNLCTKCMQDHGGKECNNDRIRDCKHCQGRHYHVLCPKLPISENKTKKSTVTATCSISTESKRTTILPTMELSVTSKKKDNHRLRVLLDQCSQRSFILKETLNKVRYEECEPEELEIIGFTSSDGPQSYQVVKVSYRYHGKVKYITAVVVDKIPDHHTKGIVSPHLLTLREKGYKLADNQLKGNKRFDMLIGGDHYYDIVHPGYKKEGELVLLPTIKGYVITGTCLNTSHKTEVDVVTVLKVAINPTEKYVKPSQEDSKIEDLNALWNLDNIGIVSNELDQKSKRVLTQFENSMSYDQQEGRYEVALPWNDNKDLLQNNYGTALGRLRGLQRRFIQDPTYLSHYLNILRDQEERNFIEKIPDSEVGSGSHVHYLPHHGVHKDSVTTPIRIVYDCSAKAANGISLNDCLESGPSLVPDLTKVLLRFRVSKYACISDIEKAYLMLKLKQEDRDSVRFLFPRDPTDLNSSCEVYRFKVVLFGATCSQFLLNATILYHLDRMALDNTVIQSIKDGLYIDNLHLNTNSEAELIQLYTIAKKVFMEANLNLREWVTNSPQLLGHFMNEGIVTQQKEVVKVLGLQWNVNDDVLSFCSSIKDTTVSTKRECLSVLARVFDPLGLLLPVTIRARIGLQDLWRSKVEWDEPLQEEVVMKWERTLTDINECINLSVQRAVTFSQEVEIHVFSDASTQAYGTALYIVAGGVSKLVIAKAKVAPLKPVTVPKLELTAVLLSARLLQFVCAAYLHEFEVVHKYLWCDSQIALHWLRNDKTKPLYVTHRVDEILDLTVGVPIRYVPTAENPADLMTRGLSASQLSRNALWWEGPTWLTHGEWPEDLLSGELTESTVTALVTKATCEPFMDWHRFGSYSKAVRVVAWILRFISNLKATTGNKLKTSDLTLSEERKAEAQVIKWVQREGFPEEWQFLQDSKSKVTGNVHKINQLGMFLEHGYIRCRGRLQMATMGYTTKYPILMPTNHHITQLLVHKCHKLSCHYGVNYVLAYMRRTWWIPRMRQVVKKVQGNCKICKRMQMKPFQTPTNPPLPDVRVQKMDPFTCTGVDYTGAINIRSHKDEKGYIVLFTCATTRAVHLEVVDNLSSETFIHVFRRFVARRGYPRILLSDNATNFVGAASYLKTYQSDPKVAKVLKEKGCEWRFVPARAPWFGAIWERLIGVLKMGIRKVLGRALINLEELRTLVSELEATVNDRPLTYVVGELEDLEPLTPSMLVHGRRLIPYPFNFDEESLEDPTYMEGSKEMNVRLEYITKLSKHLWKRWSNEYLTFLKQKGGFTNTNRYPNPGDVVLVHDDGPRLYWRLARVIELIKGMNGIVRVVKLRVGKNETTRPITKLYPLEQSLDSLNTHSLNSNPSEVSGDQSRIQGLDTQDSTSSDGSGEQSRPQRMSAQRSITGWRRRIEDGSL